MTHKFNINYQQEHNVKPFPGLLNAAKWKITFFFLLRGYNQNVYQINLKLLLALWWTLIWSLPKPVNEKPFLLQKGFWEDTSRLDVVIYFVEVCLSQNCHLCFDSLWKVKFSKFLFGKTLSKLPTMLFAKLLILSSITSNTRSDSYVRRLYK